MGVILSKKNLKVIFFSFLDNEEASEFWWLKVPVLIKHQANCQKAN
jgi:hypothetical protein